MTTVMETEGASPSVPSEVSSSVAVAPCAHGRGVDRFGAVASSLCAVHCMACAFLPAAFGMLGLGALQSHRAEWVFTLTAVALASGALILGWRRHRSVFVAAMLTLGIVGLLASRGLEMTGAHAAEAHGHGDEREISEVAAGAGAVHDDADAPCNTHAETAHAVVVGAVATGAEHQSAATDDGCDTHNNETHRAGAIVGIFGGLLLVMGHVANLRMTRRCQSERCN